MTIFVICVGSSLLSKATDVTLCIERNQALENKDIEVVLKQATKGVTVCENSRWRMLNTKKNFGFNCKIPNFLEIFRGMGNNVNNWYGGFTFYAENVAIFQPSRVEQEKRLQDSQMIGKDNYNQAKILYTYAGERGLADGIKYRPHFMPFFLRQLDFTCRNDTIFLPGKRSKLVA